MPLITITGYPSSGKTTRALQISGYFHGRIAAAQADPSLPDAARITRLKVHHVNADTLGLSRTVYRDAKSEKEARATEYSAWKRALGKDDVVIADGLNYIKGFRYQLFCEAKALLTPSCVVHVGTPQDTCRLWNTTRNNDTSFGDSFKPPVVPAEDEEPAPAAAAPPETAVESTTAATAETVPHGCWGGYPDDVFENLIFRYEEPNGMTRWDSPLFTVPYMDEKPDLEGIWEATVGRGVKVKANQATVLRPAAESNYLYELDKTTQEVVTLIMEHQKNSGGSGGGSLPVPDCSSLLELPPQALTVPQLQRIRRQFISLNRQHSVAQRRIRELFVEYVNGNFR
ncbi:kti12, chromatin associated [Rhizina undulata]